MTTFREELRDWLAEHVPSEPLLDWRESADPENFERLRAWERALFAGGFGAVTWPPEYGGRGLGALEQLEFAEECAAAGAPPRVNDLSVGVVGPTLIAFGTDEQKARFLPPLLRGDEIWCQGFSEPDAGSDLAAVRMTAIREGDALVLNGQKVWTSLAGFADWMLTLVSTAPGERHRGLSCLIVDMRGEGVEVRPLVQITQDPQFGEVFLHDVRVPLDRVLGPVDGGWDVLMHALEAERAMRLANYLPLAAAWERVRALAAESGDESLRERVAAAYVDVELFRLLSRRAAETIARDGSLGAEASLVKICWSETNVRLYELALDVLGPRAELWECLWSRRYLYARAGTIYAGTNEIQRNIVAERLLGLPRG